MREVTKRYVHTAGESWYVICHNGEAEPPNYSWVWHETGEYDFGDDFETIEEALLDAARDWDAAGSGRLMSRRLRLAASQYGKMTANYTRR